MNWEAAGAIGEIIGATAVIGTLLYLGLQIRQQNLAQQLQVKESILEGFNRANEHLATNPDLGALFVKGLHDPDILTDSESAQFSFLLRLYVNQYQKMYSLFSNGSLSRQEWENFAAQGAWMLNKPGGKRWLDGHRSTFSEFTNELLNCSYDDTSIDFTMGREWSKYSGH